MNVWMSPPFWAKKSPETAGEHKHTLRKFLFYTQTVFKRTCDASVLRRLIRRGCAARDGGRGGLPLGGLLEGRLCRWSPAQRGHILWKAGRGTVINVTYNSKYLAVGNVTTFPNDKVMKWLNPAPSLRRNKTNTGKARFNRSLYLQTAVYTDILVLWTHEISGYQIFFKRLPWQWRPKECLET